MEQEKSESSLMTKEEEGRQELVRARIELSLFAAAAASGYVMARFIEPGHVYLFTLYGLLGAATAMGLIDRGGFHLPRPYLPPLLFSGCAVALIPFLIMTGANRVSPSLAATLVICNALMIPLLARALGRTRLTGQKLIALAAGFGGVVWIGLLEGEFHGATEGVALLLGAAFLIAASTVAVERAVVAIGAVKVSRWTMWIGLPVGVATHALTGHVWYHSAGQAGLGLLFGVMSLAAPVLLFNLGMGRIGSADAASFKLLIPFIALGYSVLLFSATPDPQSALAALLIIAAVALYQRAARKERLDQ